MADEPENHTLRLLREIREEIAKGFDAMRAENEVRFKAIDARFDAIDARFDGIDARFEVVERVLGKTIDAVMAIAKVQDRHTESLQIVEGYLSVIAKRVERIEKHTGLVRA
jgi:hypothetical protein